MLTSKVAKRYAQGLLDFTQESGSTPTVFSEMKDIVKIMKESKDLNAFFATPFIDSKKKMEAAGEIFKNFSKTSKNIVNLVIKQGRETHLKHIAQEFVNKVEDMQGIQRVTITSAAPLSQQNVEEIIKSSNLVDINRGFDLTTNIDHEMIGGYILRVGDQQVDASMRTKLNRLKKDFQLN